jgi:ABC-type branched-subunit amino acid transport system permease subunit
MTDLLPHILNGLTLGLLFALIALGFMLIVGVMEVINLAHGSLFALGAYFALTLIGRGWFGDRISAVVAIQFRSRRYVAALVLRAAPGGRGRHGARALPAAAPTARRRSTGCCSPSAPRWSSRRRSACLGHGEQHPQVPQAINGRDSGRRT